jgi:aldehyde:ferredoxin oxidoreductase
LWGAIVDMTGLCTTTSLWFDIELMTANDYAKLIKLAAGWAIDGDQLMNIGDRIYNIEKAFNTLHAGFRREDDLPPRKLVEIPVGSGEFAGEKLDLHKWDQMLDEYYESHGWDKQTGWQKRSCLERLGLLKIAEELGKAGRLIDD